VGGQRLAPPLYLIFKSIYSQTKKPTSGKVWQALHNLWHCCKDRPKKGALNRSILWKLLRGVVWQGRSYATGGTQQRLLKNLRSLLHGHLRQQTVSIWVISKHFYLAFFTIEAPKYSPMIALSKCVSSGVKTKPFRLCHLICSDPSKIPNSAPGLNSV
jgi:hypothetical protein